MRGTSLHQISLEIRFMKLSQAMLIVNEGIDRQRERQTDRQIDRQIDRQ